MSKSKANELLQKLVYGLLANWRGEDGAITSSNEAYKLCEEIVKEAKEN